MDSYFAKTLVKRVTMNPPAVAIMQGVYGEMKDSGWVIRVLSHRGIHYVIKMYPEGV